VKHFSALFAYPRKKGYVFWAGIISTTGIVRWKIEQRKTSGFHLQVSRVRKKDEVISSESNSRSSWLLHGTFVEAFASLGLGTIVGISAFAS
jgi:hypothetical protein